MRLTPAAGRALGVGLLLPTFVWLVSPASAAQSTSTNPTPRSTSTKPAGESQPTKPAATSKSAKPGGESQPTKGAAARKSAKPAPKRATAKDRKAETRTAAAQPTGSCVHVVKRGETMTRLSAQYKVPQTSIASANHLGTPSALKAGQRIEIPGCKTTAVAKATSTARVAPVSKSRSVPEPVAVDSGPGELLARVGPRRIPTRLFVAVPEFYVASTEFRWPIDGPILSGFGYRSGGWHAGVDIRGERGAPIRASAPGVVVFSGAERFYGRMVKIDHPTGFTTIYAHNLENLVQVGDRVDTSTVIATVGRTGHASGFHVHFEIRREGTAYNPVHLLDPRDGPILVSNTEPPPEEEFGP